MNGKEIGFGTLSLLLCIMAIVWSFTFHTICIGDMVLGFLNIHAWSNTDTGVHYTVFYSLIFLVPAFLLSRKHKEHFAAKTGGFLSTFIGLFLLLSLFGLSV